jgi:outer membrane protein assembly factor BamB
MPQAERTHVPQHSPWQSAPRAEAVGADGALPGLQRVSTGQGGQPQAAAAAVAHGEGVQHRVDRRGGRKRRPGRVLLALAVVGAVGGGAVVAMHRGDAAPSASRHLKQVWQVASPAADDELVGSWVTDKLLVRASTRGGVTAYSLADGSTAWTAALPAKAAGAGTQPCAMSPTLTAAGLGTVAFGKDGHTCTSLAGIDAATGTVLWTVPLVDAGHKTAMGAQTFLQGDVATVVGENFLGGLDVRTGHRVWGLKSRGYYCNAYTWGGPGVVLVDDYCADSGTHFTLTAYDGATGRTLWSQTQDAHTDIAHVFSGSPLIASEHKAGEDSVRVVAPSGASRKLAVGNTELLPGNDSAADHSARLVGGVLVTPATTAAGSEVDAFDTATGAKLWSYPATALATSAADGDRVYALAGSPSAPQVVALDPRTGHATAVAALPAATGKRVFTAGTVYVTAAGGVLELDAQGTGVGVRFSL